MTAETMKVPSRWTIKRKQVVQRVAEMKAAGKEITGREKIEVNGETFTMNPRMAKYVDPLPPLGPLDIPSRFLAEFQHDPLTAEFLRLEREVAARAGSPAT